MEGDIKGFRKKVIVYQISIHALRVEGDVLLRLNMRSDNRFLSTPSGWRATQQEAQFTRQHNISIHALRVEGDLCEACHNKMHPISIHALRVEGDGYNGPFSYGATLISIHALRVEGDLITSARAYITQISIHALRVEGDACRLSFRISSGHFYPRPPGGGRHDV